MKASNTTGTKTKWLYGGLGVVALGVLSYFGYEYYKKHKKKVASSTNNSAATKTAANTQAPTETESPNVKANGRPVMDTIKKVATKFKDKIKANRAKKQAAATSAQATGTATKKKSATLSTDAADDVARALQMAAMNHDLTKVLEQLNLIKNVKDYSRVNNVFKKLFLNGVRQTLVNGLLSSFSKNSQKDALAKAFYTIGLQYDGKQWTLAGLDGHPVLITNRETKVWKDPRTAVPVPVNMVLGKEVARRGAFTMFQNGAQHFLVESAHVNQYQA